MIVFCSELGCPTTFSARIMEENNNLEERSSVGSATSGQELDLG